ncbi:UPF0223 family protein [Bacillus timonensis]|uniref:UPF0223 family protein n=1 Tax=Bacillus timonensis TaxID=1033734 RepID=UPI000289B1DF|nr:UPF0223 family protein [Bacillus timonensis]
MDYQYPISYEWNTEEVVDVIAFFECVEKAYEKGIAKEQMMKAYKRFKEIVPSKSEEKQVCGEFEETSGYSAYRVIQKAKENTEIIKM